MRILICGHRSFAATGLVEALERAGHAVETFSRGDSERSGNHITGNVFTIDESKHLSERYDFVINFIIIKNESVGDNLRYARALVNLCNRVRPRALIQISSISAYSRERPRVVETTPISTPGTARGPYAAIKSEVDHHLESADRQFPICFVRPGFITDPSVTPSMAGVARRLCGPVHLLMGDRKTPLPQISRADLHEALARIVEKRQLDSCYLLCSNRQGTKYAYARKHLNGPILSLPRTPTLLTARFLKAMGLFSERQYFQVRGLFCRTSFDPSVTEKALGMEFR